jgi:hypothetical protein
MNDIPKVCAVEGCENVIPRYRLSDVLCHDHGSQEARQTRKKRRHDPGELEAFQRALREETMVSLILDPSRWVPENTLGTCGVEGRHRPRAQDANRCPGWVCGVILDAPLLAGQYCSVECKRQTSEAREAFRCELTQLRAAAKRREAVVA